MLVAAWIVCWIRCLAASRPSPRSSRGTPRGGPRARRSSRRSRGSAGGARTRPSGPPRRARRSGRSGARAIARMRGSIASARRPVNARETRLRSASWRGGSIDWICGRRPTVMSVFSEEKRRGVGRGVAHVGDSARAPRCRSPGSRRPDARRAARGRSRARWPGSRGASGRRRSRRSAASSASIYSRPEEEPPMPTVVKLGIKRPVTRPLLPDPDPRPVKYTFISVDDHLMEPPHAFEGRMPRALRGPGAARGRDRGRPRGLVDRGHALLPGRLHVRGGAPARRPPRRARALRRGAARLLGHRRADQGHGHRRHLRVGELPVRRHRLRRHAVLGAEGSRSSASRACARGTTGCSRSGTRRIPTGSFRSASPISPIPRRAPRRSAATRRAASAR